jgi:hypothetical protein
MQLYQVNLSSLTLQQVEMGLQVVSNGVMLDLPVQVLAPPSLSRLTEEQWDSLFWAHETLMCQKDQSLVH